MTRNLLGHKNLFALLIFTVLTIAFTWPLLPHIAREYPSTFSYEGGDPNLYLSFMNLNAAKVRDFTAHPEQMLFYPNGINFFAGYEAPVILAVSTPVILATGNPILAYNIVLLLAFILTAYAAYALIWHLTQNYFASLISGFSFGLSPYMMVRGTQHLDLLLLFTVPWVALCTFKFFDAPTKKNGLWLAVSLFVTSLSAWYYLVGCVMFVGLYLLFHLRQFAAAKKQFILAGLAVALLLLISSTPMFINRSSQSFAYVSALVDQRGANPLNFFVPHYYMLHFTDVVYKYLISPYEATSYYGLVGVVAFLALTIFRKQLRVRDYWFWVTVILLFIVVAMGNYFPVGHREIPLPFHFLSRFMPFDRLRAPNRFFVFSYLGATVLFGYFFAFLQSRLANKRIFWLLAIFTLLFLTFERGIWPYPTMVPYLPEFYREIGSDPAQYAIADIPIINPGFSLYNYYQIYHKKPIVDGEYFWTIYNDQTFDFIKNNQLLYQSSSCAQPPDHPVDKSQALKQLADANIKYVVVHNIVLHNLAEDNHNYCRNDITAFVHDFFKGQKIVFSDGDINVYSTSPQ